MACTTTRRRAAAAALAAAALVPLTACTSDSQGGATDRVEWSDVSGSDWTDAPAAALVLHADGRDRACLEPGAATDLAWFDVTWEATAELESVSFRLTHPVGVLQVGGGITVPPVNFGGRIDDGGSASWAGRAAALDNRQLSWSRRGAASAWSPTTGETGLLALHLRLDERALASRAGASFTGVAATYTTRDGATGVATVDVHDTFRSRAHC